MGKGIPYSHTFPEFGEDFFCYIIQLFTYPGQKIFILIGQIFFWKGRCPCGQIPIPLEAPSIAFDEESGMTYDGCQTQNEEQLEIGHVFYLGGRGK